MLNFHREFLPLMQLKISKEMHCVWAMVIIYKLK